MTPPANEDELPLSPERPVERDVRDELAFHLEARKAELVAAGWEPEAARREAERAFGDVTRVEEECREITARTRRARRRADTVYAFGQDLLFAARLLRKSPGFATVAISTLALGIGANTAIFSVVNGVLLRPMPYQDADRIVTVRETHQNGWGDPPWANFVDLREQNRSFEAMASHGSAVITVLGADQVARVRAGAVSQDFFRVFGVRPARGRLPSAEEHREGALPVAVVSDAFWRGYMGGRTDVDQVVLRASHSYQVIGVLPPGFNYPAGADVWVPLELDRQPPSRTAHNWAAVGKLREGVRPEQAERELGGLLTRLGQIYAADFDATGAWVITLQEQLTGSMERPLYLLLGAAGLLLIAACTNLASTLLARGTARQGELAVRSALGAGRERLVRQLFAESVLLAALSAVAGVVVALALQRALLAMAPADLPGLEAVSLDGWVLAFTALTAVATAVLFGLLPAVRVSTADPSAALREGARAGSGPARQRIWSVLIATEVALAVVLLAGSGLLMRSFWRTLRVDPGFATRGVLTVGVNLPVLTYDTYEKAVGFHHRALAVLAGIPGVERVGMVNVLPLGGTNPNGLTEVEGRPISRENFADAVPAVYRIASADYFAAMGIRLIRGRTFEDRDGPDAPHVVVVSQTYAAQAWPGEDPIGKRMRPAGMDPPPLEPFATVVGVVGDARARSLTDDAPRPTYFYSYRQRPYRTRSMTVALRIAGPPAAISGTVRDALRGVDPNVPVDFRTMEERVAGTLADERFTVAVLGTFAAFALVLAAVGIYGVVSYAAARRTREMGIRMALGAPAPAVRWLMQQRVLGAVAIGGALGLVASLALSRALSSLLYQVRATDPLTILAVVVALGPAAWLASWFPARRGTRVDPMIAIRAE
ncbi:MAG TPA: ABC transporter permease [Gemmatimonadales bacterium]